MLAKPEAFISEQIVGMHERHNQFGDTLYLLQPNVKEGAGGLRDYHASYWAMQASQHSVDPLPDSPPWPAPELNCDPDMS